MAACLDYVRLTNCRSLEATIEECICLISKSSISICYFMNVSIVEPCPAYFSEIAF